jgi:hypothetical protein
MARIPEELALIYRAHHEYGLTLDELAARLQVSKWAVRVKLVEADEALKQIERDEANGTLKPRAPHETPRHKAAREAIEWRCAALRPAATKLTGTSKKPDPRTFWYTNLTIKFQDWSKELEARIRRGGRYPHAKPPSLAKDLGGSMIEMPLNSLWSKLCDLVDFTERSSAEAEQKIPLKLAA